MRLEATLAVHELESKASAASRDLEEARASSRSSQQRLSSLLRIILGARGAEAATYLTRAMARDAGDCATAPDVSIAKRLADVGLIRLEGSDASLVMD